MHRHPLVLQGRHVVRPPLDNGHPAGKRAHASGSRRYFSRCREGGAWWSVGGTAGQHVRSGTVRRIVDPASMTWGQAPLWPRPASNSGCRVTDTDGYLALS